MGQDTSQSSRRAPRSREEGRRAPPLWARRWGQHFTSISCVILTASLRWDVIISTPKIALSKAQRGHLANTPDTYGQTANAGDNAGTRPA